MALVDFVPIEGNLVFAITTVNGSGVPTDADAVPTYDIMATDLSGILLPSAESAGTTNLTTGAYTVNQPVLAADGFAAGNVYTLLASWEISSSARSRQYTFRVN